KHPRPRPSAALGRHGPDDRRAVAGRRQGSVPMPAGPGRRTKRYAPRRSPPALPCTAKPGINGCVNRCVRARMRRSGGGCRSNMRQRWRWPSDPRVSRQRTIRDTMAVRKPTDGPMANKKIAARLSPIHGNGVFATETIEKGERIVRYRGALRTHDEVDEEYGGIDED